MITVADLVALGREALAASPHPDPRWPPSVYYRYLSAVAGRLNAKTFVELGTCGGGASLTVAVNNSSTKVITIDVDKYPQVAPIEEMCSNFFFHRGDSIELADTLGQANAPIDLLFIDTTHTYEQTMGEFNAWLPYMAKGGVVCFDDLYRPGMDVVWAALPEPKTGIHDLKRMHVGGSPTDGGFGASVPLQVAGEPLYFMFGGNMLNTRNKRIEFAGRKWRGIFTVRNTAYSEFAR